MKMSEKLAKAFSEQVTMELSSSVAYLQMSAWFDSFDLPGMASWMRIQSEEERQHALRFMDFVLDRGNKLVIGERTRSRSRNSNLPKRFSRLPWPRNSRPRLRSGTCT